MKNFKSAWIGSAAASLVAGLAASGAMAAPEHVKAGTLDCDVSGVVGLIIGSQKQMTCMFTPVNGGRREAYLGTIHKFGLDIGATTGGQMAWAVFAPILRSGSRASNYVQRAEHFAGGRLSGRLHPRHRDEGGTNVAYPRYPTASS